MNVSFKNICLLSFIFLLIACGSEESPEKVTERLIDSIKLKYAPDNREAIFNIQSTFKKKDSLILLTGEISDIMAHSALVKSLEEHNLKLSDQIKVLPGNELGEYTHGLINVSVANMRKTPENSAELTTQAVLGTPVRLLKKEGEYFLVQTPDNYLGWLHKAAFVQQLPQQQMRWMIDKRIITTKTHAHAYESPSDRAEKVSDLVPGCILVKNGRLGNFFKVIFPDGREGYVKASEAEDYATWSHNMEINEDKLVETAKAFIGFPYLWGGTSSKGFDCSGFVKTIYFINGVVLARDASLQYLEGKEVSKQEDLKPGDLVFFGEDKITHVGMYIGNNEYIHASGMVKINSFDETKTHYNKYRSNTYKGAKRISNSLDSNGIILVGNHTWYNYYE